MKKLTALILAAMAALATAVFADTRTMSGGPTLTASSQDRGC
jgi:hypothetical protein